MTRVTPAQAWANMLAGNKRFVEGAPAHPRQNVERRKEVAHDQNPSAALFGCSDSRLAAEIIFDKGLGDLFVVRNAGQIISDSVVASLEYAVAILGVPLIIVLGHDNCGAVNGAINMLGPYANPLPRISPIWWHELLQLFVVWRVRQDNFCRTAHSTRATWMHWPWAKSTCVRPSPNCSNRASSWVPPSPRVIWQLSAQTTDSIKVLSRPMSSWAASTRPHRRASRTTSPRLALHIVNGKVALP